MADKIIQLYSPADPAAKHVLVWATAQKAGKLAVRPSGSMREHELARKWVLSAEVAEELHTM